MGGAIGITNDEEARMFLNMLENACFSISLFFYYTIREVDREQISLLLPLAKVYSEHQFG